MAVGEVEHAVEADPASSHVRRTRAATLATAAIATTAFAIITGVVVLVRAGGTDYLNWPVNWELGNSDSGVLYQVFQDVFAGRPLDWNFSGQVYVFPEMFVSFLAYVFGAGSIYRYFLLVAVINNALMFLTIFATVRLRDRSARTRDVIVRSALAALPLIVLPLIGTPWLGFYHLGATYYFGMYLLIFAAPLIFLVRSRTAMIALGAVFALVAASNPLALVFTVPAFVVVLIVKATRTGIRSVRRPALLVLAILALTLVIRVGALQSLQGKALTNYMDFGTFFSYSLPELTWYFQAIGSDPLTGQVLIVLAVASVLLTIAAIVLMARYRTRRSHGVVPLTTLYFALIPITGLAGTAVLAITHYLYAWPILVAPTVFLLAAIPIRVARIVLPVGLIVTIIAASMSGGVANLSTPTNYFGSRAPDTRCIDELPESMTLGYATFTDARRLAQTSKRHVRLIPVGLDGVPNSWLSNDATPRNEFGTFYVVSTSPDPGVAIDIDSIAKIVGEPDGIIQCESGTSEIAYFTDPVKLEAIETFYRTLTGG